MIPRARVRLWTSDGVELTSYTCPERMAYEDARAALREESQDVYATVTPLEGGRTVRISWEEAQVPEDPSR